MRRSSSADTPDVRLTSAGRAGRDRARWSRSGWSSCPTPTSDVLGLRPAGSSHCRAASPHTTPDCFRRSRSASRHCSSAGLVKVVFATETLALGINMPARTRGDREADEVERRYPRRRHAGRVHPAHRPGRATRHRPGGARGRGVALGRRPLRGRRPCVDAHVPAAILVPAVLQHGGQPGRPSGRAAARTLLSRPSRSSSPIGPSSDWLDRRVERPSSPTPCARP